MKKNQNNQKKPSLPQKKVRVLKPSAEDLEKIAASKRDYATITIDMEDYLVAQLGFYFGFTAIQAYFNDEITTEKARDLINGAKKIQDELIYDIGIAAAAGGAPKAFDKIMKPFLNKIQVE